MGEAGAGVAGPPAGIAGEGRCAAGSGGAEFGEAGLGTTGIIAWKARAPSSGAVCDGAVRACEAAEEDAAAAGADDVAEPGADGGADLGTYGGASAERWIVGRSAEASGVAGPPATGSALTGCCGDPVPGVARTAGTLGVALPVGIGVVGAGAGAGAGDVAGLGAGETARWTCIGWVGGCAGVTGTTGSGGCADEGEPAADSLVRDVTRWIGGASDLVSGGTAGL